GGHRRRSAALARQSRECRGRRDVAVRSTEACVTHVARARWAPAWGPLFDFQLTIWLHTDRRSDHCEIWEVWSFPCGCEIDWDIPDHTHWWCVKHKPRGTADSGRSN